MTATSLQFGPEWMRNKQQTTPSSTRSPVSVLSPNFLSNPPPAPSSYSSLLTAAPAPLLEKQDSTNPFNYSKEDMLQVWKDGGGRGGLGLEVELWEGVIREVGGEPVGLREMSEGERKVCTVPRSHPASRSLSHISYATFLDDTTNTRTAFLTSSQFRPAATPITRLSAKPHSCDGRSTEGFAFKFQYA